VGKSRAYCFSSDGYVLLDQHDDPPEGRYTLQTRFAGQAFQRTV